MFTTIPVNEDHIIGIKAEGVLTDEDYKKFLPELERFIEQEGPISAYIDMTEFKGWKARAAWDDLKFGIAHDLDFKRIAVVGRGTWPRRLIRVVNIFFTADMRFFPEEEKKQAMEWLLEKEETEQPVPVGPSPYRHILVATDFSPQAEAAARRALEFLDLYNAHLSVVHVLDNMILYDDFTDPLPFDQVSLYRELEESSHRMLDNLAEKLELGNRAEFRLLSGSPAHEIITYAEEHQADLIVVGCHGKKGLERLIGSVAAAIVKRSSCDVLTVHAGK